MFEKMAIFIYRLFWADTAEGRAGGSNIPKFGGISKERTR